MSFKKFLQESNIIQDLKFIKSIEKWIENSNAKDLVFVLKNKSKIPAMFKKEDTFYRGMKFSQEDYDNIMAGGEFTFKTPVSWSKDKKIAERFITDKKYKIGSTTNTVNVLLKKKFSPVIDIHSYMLFAMGMGILDDVDELVIDSAMKEFEVLADIITITKKDIINKI